METLSNGHKSKLRNQIITGARNYNKYLVNKVFKIVCADGLEVDVRFFPSDYKHLTGLYSNLGDDDFYRNCVLGTIDVGNIATDQKYNWSTLRTKGKHVEKIHELFYKDGGKSLLLEVLDTRTCIFPYAVKSPASNMCIGFATDVNKARTLRKASASTKSKAEKRIIAIFAKQVGNITYNELVYVSNVVGIYEKDELLLDKLDDSLQMKFLEIITKPEQLCV
ncbi:PBECR4 domain-containing protein [Roseburia hominis]